MGDETLFIYENFKGIFYAYVGKPWPLEYMDSRANGAIHDHECNHTGCACTSIEDWYGI